MAMPPALHQRLHDQRGNLRVFARQQFSSACAARQYHICPGFARLRLASVGAGPDKAVASTAHKHF